MHKRKLFILISTFALVSVFISSSARADSEIKVSFVMINPLTGLNAGAGTHIGIHSVNRDGKDPADINTNESGVATFTIKAQQYTLGTVCSVCYLAGGVQFGTNYLVIARSDGSVEVLSADGEPVTKDASGNWMLTTQQVRKAISDDPWQLMTTKPNLPNNVARVAWLLTNGKILVQTTQDQQANQISNWWTITPDVNGNYYDGTWKQLARTPDYNPWAYNGAVLHSGNFFITGGEVNFTDAGVFEADTNESYIYNVSKNTWTEVAPPNNGQGYWSRISAPPFTTLANGKVMIGNWDDRAPGSSHESMLFDETTMKWTLTGTNKSGMNSEAGYALLPDGKVLTVNTDGGGDTAEVYDPATGLWSKTGAIPYSLAFSEVGPALTLPNGKVLAQGATGANALYDPETNSWALAASFPKLKNGLQLSAPDNPTAILPNGNLLTVTSYLGRDTNNLSIMGPTRYLEYDWMSNTWLPVIEDLMLPPSSGTSTNIKMLPLPNGQIMVINMNANPGSGGIAFYTSKGVSNPSWAPIVDSISSVTLAPEKSFNISGKQLSGLTQGAQFGDEFESATNYPLVRVVNNISHHVFYAATSNFSSTSIAPMTPSTFDFTIESNFEDGPSKLYVVANGIASDPVDVTITGAYDKVAADKAVAEKAAAELKAKQDAEVKAAAELKAKQDAEVKAAADKAAAELKAKQDAEAKVAAAEKAAADKAAAELKAKQDAEAKAAAELKSKQDADAKAAADKLAKAAAQKKTTITCIKGKSSKKITAIKPACPAGYKKK